MLFTEFQTNYNDEPEMYKKGTVVYKEKVRACTAVRALFNALLGDDILYGKSK